MWLCKRDLSKECKGDYKDCLDCVLEKIRAEITEYAIPDFEYHGCGGSQKIVELEDVLEIIDKYKAESEDEE